MILLPYDNFTITSSKTCKQAMEIITDVTQKQERLSISGIRLLQGVQKHFIGELRKNSFKISRVVVGKNSFLPVIEGEVHKDPNGSKINITMSVSSMLRNVITIILGIVAFMAMYSLIIKTDVANNFEQFLTWMIVFAVVYLFMMVPYRKEAKKNKKLLIHLFKENSSE